jgi:hypothetical protein
MGAMGNICHNGDQVQYTTKLSASNWVNLGDVLTSPSPVVNRTLSATDANGPDTQRFYRVLLVQ